MTTSKLLTVGCSGLKDWQEYLTCVYNDIALMERIWLRYGQLAHPLPGETLDKTHVLNLLSDMAALKGVRAFHFTGHGGNAKLSGMKRAESFLWLGISTVEAVIWAHELIGVLCDVARNGDPVPVFIDTCHAKGQTSTRGIGVKKQGPFPRKYIEPFASAAAEPEDYTEDIKLPGNVIVFSACGRREYALGGWYSNIDSPTGYGNRSSTHNISLATYAWGQVMLAGVQRANAIDKDASFLAQRTLISASYPGNILPTEVPNMRLRNKHKDKTISMITGKWTS